MRREIRCYICGRRWPHHTLDCKHPEALPIKRQPVA